MRHFPNEELVRWASRLPPDAAPVLEVGCGNGCNLPALSDPVGADCSVSGLRLARGRRALSSVSALPFLSESFGAVADCLCLQHLPFIDQYRATTEILRVLRPGGRFFSYRFGDNDPDLIEQLFPDLGTTTCVDPDELEAGLSHLGFDCTTELVRKSYRHRQVFVEYVVLDAQKR